MPGRDGGASRDGGLGRDGGRGRAGGWGTCVFLHKNVRRNRLECRFGAEYRGKSPVFFTGFFPRGTGYFPCFPGFFPRKKSGEFKGKIRCYHALLLTCISDIFFIFIVCCILSMCYIYCILHIVHILHIFHILHIMYIKHIIHIYMHRVHISYVLHMLHLYVSSANIATLSCRRSKRNAAALGAEAEGAAAAAGNAWRRSGGAGQWTCPGGASGSPYPGKSA